ncbi:MAG: helix-turn-helix domain-containing protein [Mycobacterium sp.]|nr:helix-turn-helix domain-containing protein [Mycobacterium sp.]
MVEIGVGLGRLLLALDTTLVNLVEAPRGLDLPVASAALLDADDVRLGLAAAAGAADVFFLLGISPADAIHWLAGQARQPVAIFVKEPHPSVVARATATGVAVVAVEPRARWERLFRLVNHVFEHHGDRADPLSDSGTDLFGLAQSIAERTRGMVSIEDTASHVLAYSASNDEADELRRLSIMGRAGPAAHLEWLGQWGVFDSLRASTDVVRVDARPELGLRPRLAVGVHRRSPDGRRAAEFAGTIWLQQGSQPLADDVEDVLRGAAVLAARIMSRLAATPSTHTVLVRELLGMAGTEVDVAAVAGGLGIAADARAALVAFAGAPPDVLALSAGAFRADAQVTSDDGRVYVVFPKIGAPGSVTSWVRGVVAALHREMGLTVHAVIAAPLTGLADIAPARTQVDRVFHSAQRHPGAIAQVSSLDDARTTVLLDEIVSLIQADGRLVDPRIRQLRDTQPMLADTLAAYLDCFGDIAAVAEHLHVHPNTVRYRVRRLEKLIAASLDDAELRLLLTLSLRATG